MPWSYRRISLKQRLLMVAIFAMMSTMVMFIFFDDGGNTVTNGKCDIPKLDPWDASILKHIPNEYEHIQCPEAHNIMFVNESGFLNFNQSVLDYYFLRNKDLKCSYQSVERILGDKEVKFGSRKHFVLPAFVNSTYYRVCCVNNTRLVYDFLHFNPFWIEDALRENEVGIEDDDHYSVLLIGIDSVSRSHALRNLPDSYKYLMETLSAYDFRGYMKVGSNTFPNLIPLLTGKHYGKFPLVNSMFSYSDSMPLLWKNEALKRYATLYSEDRSDISTFNFLKPGFYNSPTDLYYRPYNMAMDLFTTVLMRPISTHGKKCPWECPCYATKDNFTVQVNHFKGFLNRYKGKLKFSFLWTNTAHESFDLLKQSDNILLELLQWMRANGHLDRAVTAVISDHGIRLGEFAQTYLGRLEGHFPLLNLVIPRRLEEKYPSIKKNLILNSQKLVTHFDTHKTILDIANNNFESKEVPVDKSLVARNLFSFIPETRTCADAGIPVNFCKCSSDEKISVDNLLVKSLAVYAVNQLNLVLANHAEICRRLTLYNVTDSRVQYACVDKNRNYGKSSFLRSSFSILKPRSGFDSDKCGNSGRYKLLLQTVPGKGLFEATVELIEGTEDDKDAKMILIGNIVRINRYGDQSHCIKKNALLRQYCYCTDRSTR